MTKFSADFLARGRALLPEKDQERFLELCTEPLPKTIRTRPSFKSPKNWQLSPVDSLPEAFFVDRDNKETPLGKTVPHLTGQIYIATLSSLLAAKMLAPAPGDKVLDLCAAPGSKTTFLAELVGPEGAVIANELSASRTKKLAANIDRMGCVNTVICQNDGITMQHFCDQEFDKILLDAPCSSEGFGRKSADFFRTHWSTKKIMAAAKVQKKLIESAFSMLRPGGEMIYSTCTSAPEENEAVVEHLLQNFPEAELIPVEIGSIPHTKGIDSFQGQNFSPEISKHAIRLWPHLRSAGWNSEIFFMTKVRKNNALKKPAAVKNFRDSQLKKLPKNKSAEVVSRLCKYFAIDKSAWEKWALVEHKGEILVTNSLAYGFAKKNRYQRVGLKVLDKNQNITHEFAVHFGIFAKQNVYDLSSEQTDRFLAGYDLELDAETTEKKQFAGVLLVRAEGRVIGWLKYLKTSKWKNKLDRSLIS